MFRTERLDHVALRVSNLGRSTSWYQGVLGLEERARYQDLTGRGAPPVLCSGDACVALFPCENDEPIAPFDGHIAFRLSRGNFNQAQDHLRQRGMTFKYVEYATVHSLYFPDPDGYEIELSTFEL